MVRRAFLLFVSLRRGRTMKDCLSLNWLHPPTLVLWTLLLLGCGRSRAVIALDAAIDLAHLIRRCATANSKPPHGLHLLPAADSYTLASRWPWHGPVQPAAQPFDLKQVRLLDGPFRDAMLL